MYHWRLWFQIWLQGEKRNLMKTSYSCHFAGSRPVCKKSCMRHFSRVLLARVCGFTVFKAGWHFWSSVVSLGLRKNACDRTIWREGPTISWLPLSFPQRVTISTCNFFQLYSALQGMIVVLLRVYTMLIYDLQLFLKHRRELRSKVRPKLFFFRISATTLLLGCVSVSTSVSLFLFFNHSD